MLNKDTVKLTNELLSGHVYEPTRKVAKLWLNKKATDEEYIKSLKEAICAIDEVIELFSSQMGIEMFGKEKAESIAKHAIEVKNNGGTYCDCPSCTKALEIIKILEK